MKDLRKILPALTALVLLSSVLASAQNRFALIIGNGNYQRIDKLPKNDSHAEDIAGALKNLGWNVVIQKNLDSRNMDATIAAKLAANPSNEDFFRYAVQIETDNYLIPTPEEAALDGLPGKRNSPFAEAFLKKIAAKESLMVMVSDVVDETLLLTEDQQPPYVVKNKDYSLISGGGITGTLTVHTATRGALRISGPGGQETAVISQDYSSLEIPEILLGRYTLTMTYLDGQREEHIIDIEPSGTGSVDFNYRLPTPLSNKPSKSNRHWFWDIGVSLGTTFDAPAFITAVHGSMGYSFNNAFGVSLEGGCDFGFWLLGDTNETMEYYSFYPYIHANLFILHDLYGGLGGGLMIANYKFSDQYKEEQRYIPAMDFVIGLKWRRFDLSLSWRTNFRGTSFRMALGYYLLVGGKK